MATRCILGVMTTPPGAPAKQRGIVHTLAGDLRGMFTSGKDFKAHRVVKRTLADLEEFYLTEEHQKRLARAGFLKRWILRMWWLFKGLVLKLSPARRLMLALGLFVFSNINVRGENYTLNFPGVGVALILLVLALELRDKLVAHDELETGRTLQKALMPSAAPVIAGWDIWLYTQSANEVSGDLVDALTLGPDRTALLLADVAGKGLSAALLSAKLQATVRALMVDADIVVAGLELFMKRAKVGNSLMVDADIAVAGLDAARQVPPPLPGASGGSQPRLPTLGDLGEHVNHIMYRDGVRGRFATMVCLLVSANSGAVRLLNAGHMAPLVLRGLVIEELPRGSVALGMVPVTTYFEQATQLGAGDTLVVYSDGVTEAMNGARDFFGDEQLRAVLGGQRGRTAAETGQAVVDAVTRFVGDAPVHDDVSLVVVRRTG
jgi:phosphoserine phosphatase RsbU/P